MKLYDGGRAPNPRRVRIFLAEKGVEIPLESVDMGSMGHKSDIITSKNPLQRLPILELSDGTIITESVAICRYIESIYPSPPLLGIDSVSEALVEMWQRRIEFHLFQYVANVFRHSHPAMVDWEVPQISDFAVANRDKVMMSLDWLNDELSSRRFICGDTYTIADITATVAIDFMKPSKLTIPAGLDNVFSWYDSMCSRSSYTA